MEQPSSVLDRWAQLRFAIIGPLLACPPANGELKSALHQLAGRSWTHPINGTRLQYSAATIERWLYRARNAQDPVGALRPQRRTDAGHQRQINEAMAQQLKALHQHHPSWTMQLLYDNLLAECENQPDWPIPPSYSTVRRYLKAQDWHRRRRASALRPGQLKAHQRREKVEVRSFEALYPDSLWHLDFHVCSRMVLNRSGQWVTPRLLGVIDDYSRLICHLQFYLDETAESLVHGLSQALQRRTLPRALMSDNGSAMKAAEFTGGLLALGIQHELTQVYSPEQNGKIEAFWGILEGRFMAMLENVTDLSLDELNRLCVLWVEHEYNQRTHREMGTTPLDRYLSERRVGRECPDSAALRQAFRRTVTRRQRRTDGTVSIDGKRFEIPSRYQHLQDVRLRYAQWDLSQIELLDPHQNISLCHVYPLNKCANGDAGRRVREPRSDDAHQSETTESGSPSDQRLPPLLRKLQAEFAATGLPPPYVNKPEREDEQ